MTAGTGPSEVLPLTHRSKNGTLCVRRPNITVQIRSLLGVPPERLIARARVRDADAPDGLLDETLVFFIREYHRANDESVVSPLVRALLARYQRRTIRKFTMVGLSDREADDAFVEVVSDAIDAIVDLDSDRGDFAQVRFGMYWKAKWSHVHERWWRARRRDAKNRWIDESVPESDDGTDGDQPPFDGRAPQIAAPGRTDDALLDTEAIDAILGAIRDPRHRQVYALRYVDGWPITANDPAEPCLQRYCGVTAKTISTWLTRAQADIVAAGFTAPHRE